MPKHARGATEPPMPEGIDPSRVPAHVGIVMDGNGRWARRQGLPRTAGHAAGEEALVDTAYGALDLGIRWLTVYAFSTENWRRPADEVRYLMNFNESLLLRRRDELNERGVRVRFSRPPRLASAAPGAAPDGRAEALTATNRAMTLTMAFNYGGRAEIVDAVKGIVRDRIPAAKVDEKRDPRAPVPPRHARP